MEFPILQNAHPYLLVFIHGFIGGRETWIRNDGKKSLFDHLAEDKQIRENFDFALYTYDTTIFNSLLAIKNGIGLLKQQKSRHTTNWDIETIAAELESQIKVQARLYKRIILIGHSMGGLISKKFILESLNTPEEKVGLFVSLAVPHGGSEWASLGKFISKNVQIENLSAINTFLATTNQKWVRAQNLPKRIYFRGFNDQIVDKNASISIEVEKQEIINSPDDHFSILIPTRGSSHVVEAIKYALLTFLKENNINIYEPEPIIFPDPPPPSPPFQWKSTLLILIILIGGIFIYNKFFSIHKKIVCSYCPLFDTTGLFGFSLLKDPPKTYNIIDYKNPEIQKKLGNPEFDKFALEYAGRALFLDSFQNFIELDSIKNGKTKLVHLKFNLPKDKVDWAGFGIGINKEFYQRSPGIDFENKEKWSKYPDTNGSKIRFVFMDSLTTQQPLFKFRL